ncbi:hypothetical protein GQ472_01725 [archaeon]|nr:hypothetical protein [archaeon]
MVRKFRSDAQRKAVMSKVKGRTVTFRVPAKKIPEHSEPIDVGRLTFDKMKTMSRKAGLHWFDKDSMSFFNSKLHGTVFVSPAKNVYFISSETFEEDNPDYPRKYTIRQFNPRDGSVSEVGGFQAYDTFGDATKDMVRLD